MATIAFSTSLVKDTLWVNVGGITFLIADALIGVNRFIMTFDYSTTIIVTAYIFAQLMIVWGLLFHQHGE